MGDVPPQQEAGVVQIRKTELVIDSRRLFPVFPMKRPAKQDLVVLMAFLLILGL